MKIILYLTLVLGGQAYAEVSEQGSELVNTYDVTCESYNYSYNQCALPGYILNAWVVYEYSRNACIPNHAWGYSGNVVWVDRGCQAVFRVQIQDRRPPRRVLDIPCESRDYGYHACYVGRQVIQASLLQQMSKTECIYNQSWGATADSVWVNRGCRALIRVVVDPQ